MKPNIYKESARTITTQVTTSLTTFSSRSAMYRQTEATLIPVAKPMTNVEVFITDITPYEINIALEHVLLIKTPFKFRLVMRKDDNEISIEVNGMYILHGSFDGTYRIETDSTEPVRIDLIYS